MPRGAALFLLLLGLSAGCLAGPRLALEDVFAQSDASHDGRAYFVNLRARVVNLAAEETRRVVLTAGVGVDCLSEPDFVGYVDVGNLAPGASTNVRASFEHEGARVAAPTLWVKLFHDERAQVAKECGALPVG